MYEWACRRGQGKPAMQGIRKIEIRSFRIIVENNVVIVQRAVKVQVEVGRRCISFAVGDGFLRKR